MKLLLDKKTGGRVKPCIDCKAIFVRNSNSQKRCKDCADIAYAEKIARSNAKMKNKPKQPQNKYTTEQIDWLKENRPNFTKYDIANHFNQRFGTNISNGALLMVCYYHGIKKDIAKPKPVIKEDSQKPYVIPKHNPSEIKECRLFNKVNRAIAGVLRAA